MIEKPKPRGTKRSAKLKAGVEAAHGRYSQVFARLAEGPAEIALHSASLPVLNPRPADEIVGYDEGRLPGDSKGQSAGAPGFID